VRRETEGEMVTVRVVGVVEAVKLLLLGDQRGKSVLQR
jgi:hypothetical protein